jgi:hypothetical protein
MQNPTPDTRLRALAEAQKPDSRICTCHPSEAPVPCQHKYAFTECLIASLLDRAERAEAEVARKDTALRNAEHFLAAELQHRIDSFTLAGDISTLDEMDAGLVAEVTNCLDVVRAAIRKGDAP